MGFDNPEPPPLMHFPPCYINKGANAAGFSHQKLLKWLIWEKLVLCGKNRSQ